ncbi:TerB family tellurite resistance protein [Biformimicrobium ophioploci]|uniref:TerB family tellurite resistance protein n=1 Tax=Biformimicrobium ophioploci TaxID=3036711 RepID=A0ABQ6LYZ6_9GAMM|nr:TerB family tellurite resistance protein [Microbulbifer sp. NKW57]GMG87300.1 TerB family tellurite resistance protein [Microbulbifer sp. NKW57]
MLQHIRKLLTEIGESSNRDEQPQENMLLVSAALLTEVATADHHLDDREVATLKAVLRDHYGMADGESSEMIETAMIEREKATSLFEFTRAINDRLGDPEKYQLIRNMWKVAFADEKIEPFEEHLIRRVSELIYLPHGLFTKARSEARDASGGQGAGEPDS